MQRPLAPMSGPRFSTKIPLVRSMNCFSGVFIRLHNDWNEEQGKIQGINNVAGRYVLEFHPIRCSVR